MDETYNSRAVILKRQPFSERDSRIVVYGEKTGKIELIARGTKKISSKLAGHLEPLTLSNLMVVRGRRYNYIGGAINENAFADIKGDLDKMIIAGEAVNIFQKLIKEEENDKKIFDLLVDFLGVINSKNQIVDCHPFLDFFILKLISELGHAPELSSCVVCKNKIRPGNNKFNSHLGGVVCFDCGKKGKNMPNITNDCIKVLKYILKNDFKGLTKLDISDKLCAEINIIISSFYRYNFE